MKPHGILDARKSPISFADSASANPLFSQCVAAWAWLGGLDRGVGEHVELHGPVMAEGACHYE